MRKIIIAGNWKMHKTVKDSLDFIDCIKDNISQEPEVVLFPAFTALYEVGKKISGTNIKFGAQNMHFEKKGAFTGEISCTMIIETGAKYVLLGHSERRHIFGENDELINKKVQTAIQVGLIPLLCVGETIDQRNCGKTQDVLRSQISEDLKHLKGNENFIIAYEPVWAIGTGINATPSQASEAHCYIRSLLDEIFFKGKGEDTTILYGGSIKLENVSELSAEKEIDGGLVGGASLDCSTFLGLLQSLRESKFSL